MIGMDRTIKAIAVFALLCAAAIGCYIDYQYRKWIIKNALREAAQEHSEGAN
jgi:hypothetical protein